MADRGGRARPAVILVAGPAAAGAESAEREGSVRGTAAAAARLAAVARQHGGHRLAQPTGGPEPGPVLAAAFPSARQALNAGLEMARMGRASAPATGSRALGFAICGGTREARTDTAGRPGPVEIASRMLRLASAGEIVISDPVRRETESVSDAAFDPLPQIAAKDAPGAEGLSALWRVTLPPPLPHFATPPGMEMSVAVLPFAEGTLAEGSGGETDTEQDMGLGAGLTEDVIIGLARFRHLRVIARSAAFYRVPHQLPAALAAFQLGVRFVVEGRVRRAPGRLRVIASLVDGRNGICLWNGHYDRSAAAADPFALQDELAGAIVQTLVWQLDRLAGQRVLARGGHLDDLSAQDLAVKARAVVLDSPQALRRCRTLYQRASRSDPDNAAALAGAALTFLVEWMSGWGRSRRATLGRALPLLRRAAELDPLDAVLPRRLGVLHLMDGTCELAAAHLDRALLLNPNDGDTLAFHALYHIFRSDPQRALQTLEKATAGNPFHPSYYYWFIGLAQYMAGQYQAGLGPLGRAIGLYPKFPAPHWHAAACHGQLGQEPQAAAERRRILEAMPGATISRIARTLPCQNPRDLDHYCEGLRRAGLRD